METIRCYFDALFKLKGDREQDQRQIMQLSEQCRFKEIGEVFKLIDTPMRTIYIPAPENAELLRALRASYYNKGTLRHLQRDDVSVYEDHYRHLKAAGKLETTPDGFLILIDPQAYRPGTGPTIDADSGQALFV